MHTLTLVLAFAIGTTFIAAGTRHAIRGARLDAYGNEQMIFFGRAFRLIIVGISAIVAAFGFTYDHPTLAWLFVVIGVEELWESSVLLAILESGARSRALEQ